jgi:hypothetical protein
MVGVPGAELQNTDPPSLAPLALAAWHAGLALLLRAPVAGWLECPRLWTAVVAVNSVVLTVFLWHMVPVVVGAALLYPTGLMPQPPIGSAAWLALRVVWVAVLGVPLVLLGRFDRPTLRRSRPRTVRAPGWALPVAAAGVAAVCGGMLWLVLGRFRGPGPADLPVTGLTLYLLGLLLLRAAGRRAPSTSGS